MTSQINSKENKPKMSTSIKAQQKPSSTAAATTPLTQKTLFSFFKSPTTSSTNNLNVSSPVTSPTVQKTSHDSHSTKKRLTKDDYVEIDEEEEEDGGNLQFLTPTSSGYSQQPGNLSTKGAISAASASPFANMFTPLTPVTSDKRIAESEGDQFMDEIDEDTIRSNLRLSRQKKRIRYHESEDEEENNKVVDAASSSPLQTPTDSDVTPTQKRRKTLTRKSSRSGNNDDGDDDFDPAGENDKDNDDDETMDDVADDDTDDYASERKQMVTPKTTKSTKSVPASFSFKALQQNDKIKHLASSTSAKRGGDFLNPKSLPASSVDKKKDRDKKFKEKNEERYAWLQDIRDEQNNPEDSPHYDPRTLYVPPSAWAHFTPFEKQFWEIKAKHWDTVVFFKKGKFYELYEKDADVGHREFDLKLTDRVNMRMVGVPESSFDQWATRFVANGHKIAKVVQMETAIGKSMREAKNGKEVKSGREDKIIRRELSCVLTAGTLVDTSMLTAEMGTYCMSVKEYSPADHLPPSFGIAFVDTSTAEFHLVAFDDDLDRTKFETLVMQVKPREIVCEKGHLTQRTTRILKNNLVNPLWNALISEREFWDATTTKDEFRIAGYFDARNDGKNNRKDEMELDRERTHTGEESWPQAIQDALNKPLMMSALGGLTWYLRSLKLDTELISLRNFHRYDPIRQTTSLVLDGQTLANLDILENSQDGTADGTLHQLLNHATTPFGKRLFRKWLCHPLRAKQEIDDRLDAVEDLMGCEDMQDLFRARFAHVVDLERVISRVHAGTCKVKDFLAVLAAFKTVLETMREFAPWVEEFKSKRLHMLLDTFPDIKSKVDYFNGAFDMADVDIDYQKLNTIIPRPGVEEDWDEVNASIKDIEHHFEKHLAKMKKQLGSSKLVYKDIGKERYQLEVPKEIKMPAGWSQQSATSKVSRYWDSTIRDLVRRLQEAEETKNGIVKGFQARIYARFDEHYALWLDAVKRVAEIDCLLGLARASVGLGEPACRPEFVEEGDSLLEFEDLRHPCVVPGVATDFIPNDTYLGGDRPNIILLTGPNMGGKSTLLRQTCVAIIMAQLGCYVPARRCRLTPFDRIYTRIGANDNILAGQSTFMVELAETSRVLREATPRSMVILDELGRGTSTFDGYAIAYAVLHYLATHVGCLGLFSTHYQTLCREFERCSEVENMHMGYQVDEEQREVTFLYKLTAGACEKSFGMNVATMAGVPQQIVIAAERAAARFEETHRLRDTTFAVAEGDPRHVLPLTMLSDFAYLMRAAGGADDDAEGAGNKLKADRQAKVLKRIVGGLKGLKKGELC